jgi:hypothetical protein
MLNSVKFYGSTAASNSAGVGSIPTTDARPHIEIDGVRFLYTNAADEWDAIRAVLGGVKHLNKVSAARVLSFALQVVEVRASPEPRDLGEPNDAA